MNKIIKDRNALESYLQQRGPTVGVIACLYIQRYTNVSPNAKDEARINNVCLVREGIIDADELANIVDTTVNNGTTCTCIRNNNYYYVHVVSHLISLSASIVGYFYWMRNHLWQHYKDV